jgi:flagellar biosynthesis chaperone FliJ
MESVSITIIGLITSSGAIGTFLGYYLYKRKNNAEAATQEATAKQGESGVLESNFKIYQSLIDDLEKRFKTALKDLEIEVQELKKELEQCKKKYLKIA